MYPARLLFLICLTLGGLFSSCNTPEGPIRTLEQAIMDLPDSVVGLTPEERQMLRDGESLGSDLSSQSLVESSANYWKVERAGEGDYGYLEIKIWWDSDSTAPVLGLHQAYESMGEEGPYQATSSYTFVQRVGESWHTVTEEVISAEALESWREIPDFLLSFSAEPEGFQITNTLASYHWTGKTFEGQALPWPTRASSAMFEGTLIQKNRLEGGLIPEEAMEEIAIHFAEGTSLEGEALQYWYPMDGSAWAMNWYGHLGDTPTELHPRGMHTIGDDRLFWYEFEFLGEAEYGNLQVVRLLRDGEWHSEAFYLNGPTAGALPGSKHGMLIFTLAGFEVVYGVRTDFPHPMAYVEASLDVSLQHSSTEVYHGIFELVSSTGLSLAVQENHTEHQFRADAALRKQIVATGSASEAIATVEASDALNDELQHRLVWELHKAERDALEQKTYPPQANGIPDLMDALVTLREEQIAGEVKYEREGEKEGWVTYRVEEAQGEQMVSYTLVFNTPRPLRLHGEGLDEVANFLNRQEGVQVSLLAGTLTEVADFTGSGQPGYVLREETTAPTAILESQRLLYRNAYGELVATDLRANSKTVLMEDCPEEVGHWQTIEVEAGDITLRTQQREIDAMPCATFIEVGFSQAFGWNAEWGHLKN